MSETHPQKEERGDWLERPRTLRILWIALYASCALTVVLELFVPRHPHFQVDGMFGFYAILGFVSCAVLIVVAKIGGLFLKREETYYQDED